MATWHQNRRPAQMPQAPFVVVQDAPHSPMGYVCFNDRESAETCLANIQKRGGAYARHSYIYESRA